MTSISFSDVPGFPNLFLDYVNEFENVSEYYAIHFRDTDAFENHFKAVSKGGLDRRRKVSEIIMDGYAGSDPSSGTRVNIAALKSPDCIAVVTGQQLGMLGGPLYTTYKIITAIKLCAKLKSEYPHYSFIPVFWLEADDHDYDEVRMISLLNTENERKEIAYQTGDDVDVEKGTVGELRLTDAVDAFFDEYRAALKETEFTAGILEKLQSHYRQGATFKQAFRSLLFDLFDQYGLVIFDPQSGGLKELLKPLFAKEILHHQDHALKVVTVSAKLEEVYHAQVKARTVNLFYHYNDARYAIEPDDDDGFRLRRKKMRFSKEELLALIEKHPAKFSPNVLLRPVCQDYLLPTGFYIAGPAETCYFAQAMPLYDAMGVTAPVIYPRASVTLIEKHLNEALTKLKLTINDLFTKSDEMQHTALRNALGFDIESLFNETQNEIAARMDRLTALLATMDKTTADAGQRYKVKLISALLEYKGKALQSELRKQSAVTGQLNKIRGSVFPGEKLQERVFNLFFFANKFGLSVVDRIFEQIQPDLFEHQIIEIG